MILNHIGIFKTFFSISDSFANSFSGKFYIRLTPPNLLKPWNTFGLENQPFSKYHVLNVKVPQFTCIHIENSVFAVKNCD